MFQAQASVKLKVLRIVGIMNGTSIDGIDFVLCDVIRKNKDVSIRFVDQAAVSFDAEIQKNLRLACQNNLAVEDLATLHHDDIITSNNTINIYHR